MKQREKHWSISEQYTRRYYQAVAATAVKSAPTSDKVMREVAWKIRKEMNDIACGGSRIFKRGA